MRVLFISTWPSESGLSKSTVHPHLKLLASDSRIERVIYVSFETHESGRHRQLSNKIHHKPIIRNSKPSLLHRILNQLNASRNILAICKEERPDFVICRGSPAGIHGVQVKRKFQLPFFVESFEPHADRMADVEVWSKRGLKYRIQRNWEKLIKREATGLITVSRQYAKHLIDNEGLDQNRVFTVPCWVDGENFKFDQEKRKSIRGQLEIGDAYTCIYVGKFGGLYYDNEAFRALAAIKEVLKEKFRLVILTPSPSSNLLNKLQQAGMSSGEVFIKSVPHEEVSHYLSAADFAISFPRSSKWSFSCSPIKHAESWACGLPVMIPERVGDEAHWAEEDGVGVITKMTDPNSVLQATKKMLKIISNEFHREQIREVALSRLNIDCLSSTYAKLIREMYNRQGRQGSGN